MPPRSKKRSALSRFVSFFSRDGHRSRAQDSARDASEGAGPSRSYHSSARSDPELPLPVTAQHHGSQFPIRQSRSENDGIQVVNFPQSPPQSIGNQDHFLQPPHFSRYDSPTGAQGRNTSIFPSASAFRMRDIHCFDGPNMTVHTGSDRSIDGWDLLLKKIAPNALPDSNTRYDAPKCDEDTRVEVTGEIMDWIQDPIPSPTQRLLCMTGAAGAGKSALQQTIAERCTGSDILAAGFFFSSTDPTRNTASAIVPTIAYQIGLKHLLFQDSIVAAVKHDPLIFSRSIQSQMEALIVRPFESLRGSNQINIGTFPYAILIDGLDECNGNTSGTLIPIHVDIDVRRQAEDQQAELLDAIEHCILDKDLPFRVFIASRPEWVIRTALEPGGHLHQVAYHIRLSDEYDASGDMRRYLQRRFELIGVRIGNPQWFTDENIEDLVEAASGQFVYVATVFKYISERRTLPAGRLKAVLTWTPHIGQTARPFESLDRLYTNILLNAKNAYEAIDTHHGRDFLLLLRAHHINAGGFPCPDMPKPFCLQLPAVGVSVLLSLEAGAEDNLISDLRSLMTFEEDDDRQIRLHLYHKSFSDFFEEESRAKDLFVPPLRVYTHLAECCMHHIIECLLPLDRLPGTWDELPLPESQRLSLKLAIDDLSFFLHIASASAIGDAVADFTHKDGWPKLGEVLPLAYNHSQPKAGFLFHHWPEWIHWLHRFAENLKIQKPEVAAVIVEFVEKWCSSEAEDGQEPQG